MRVLLIALLLMVGCNDDKKPTPKPEPVEDLEPIVVTPTDNLRKDIFKITDESDCLKYHWKNRGKAFKSYMRGMGLMYAKQICGQGSDFIKQEKVTSTYRLSWENKNRPHEDALKLYGIKGSQLETYTFLIGLGMRESNGKYCKGRDKSQNFVKSDSAEAGIYQMSYVARLFNTELEPLYRKYKKGELPCELDVFKSDAIKCTAYDAKTYGSGEGADWQKLMKRCPALSVQWASILIRSRYTHFGPIKRKEVEVMPQCRDMLRKVEKVTTGRCSSL
jgi:hypothetical protein